MAGGVRGLKMGTKLRAGLAYDRDFVYIDEALIFLASEIGPGFG